MKKKYGEIKKPSLQDRFYVNREEDEKRLIGLIEDQNFEQAPGAIAVCGSPGCGKTTFTKFLTYRVQTGYYSTNFYAERIDLEWYSTNDPGKNRPFDPDSYLSFFATVEDILFQYTDRNKRVDYNSLKDSKLFQNYKDKDNLNENEQNDFMEGLKFQFTHHLYNLSLLINEDLVIFVDDLDLIPFNQQHLFIEVFGWLTSPDNKLRIIFSARPVTSAMVRFYFRELVNKSIAKDCPLPEIKTLDVLKARYSEDEISSHLSDDCVSYLQKLCCGNVEDMLSYWREVKFSNLTFRNSDELLNYLTSNRLLPDISVKVFNGDSIPYYFLLMSMLEGPRIVSKKFLEEFVSQANYIRGKKPKSLTKSKVEDIIFKAIKNYLVRRIEFSSQESAEMTFHNPKNVYETTICLTELGLTLFKDFHKIKRNSSWSEHFPKGVQQKLIEKKFDYSKYNFESENNFMYSTGY